MQRAVRIALTASSGALCLLLAAARAPQAQSYFKIRVVDEETGRGVPLVELKTTSEVPYYTDSNGLIAFHEPGLMGRKVYFHIRSHGYEYPADMLGSRGAALQVVAGGSATVKIKRINIAERLYRITGEGIYRDSLLLGERVPVEQPALNAEITGQDTVLGVPYRGKLYWFWGDTNRLSGSLGHFGTAGATSEWPGRGGLDPSAGVNLNYFTGPSGFSRPMLDFPGPGMKWLFWMATLPDESGRERLVGRYRSMADLGKPIEGGLALYNDAEERFERFAALPEELDAHIPTHAFKAQAGGREYLYLPGPYPTLRLPATLKQAADEGTWEAFTCFAAGSRGRAAPELDRGPDGRLRYGWKARATPLTFDQQQKLVAAGAMKASEGLWLLQDVETGAPVKPHAGSVFWNAFRGRWIMIVQEDRGLADNGEIWFAEADTPVGPWLYARKIVTHDKYTFYNPTQHPFFDQEGGRLIYFEGTYTDFFSGSPVKTPRYNYNQIMYRLRLDDPRLALPVPVYRMKDGAGAAAYQTRGAVAATGAWERIEEIAFFAPERPGDGLVAAYAAAGALRTAPLAALPPGAQPLFYALPITPAPPVGIAGAWNCEARELDSSRLPFNLELKLAGSQVSGNAGQALILGSFREGALRLELKQDEETYTLTGTLKQEKLEGAWKSVEEETGTWSCVRQAPRQPASPPAVPLYEYRAASGARLYATDPALARAGLRRDPQALCRVWRNPLSLLILDNATRPPARL